MAQAAHVRSLDSLLDLHAGLVRFRAEALAVVERAVQRLPALRQALEDRFRHWDYAVREAEESFRQARSEYACCMDDEGRECSSEENEVYRTQRELRRSQESLDICRVWLNRFEEEAEQLEARLRRLREVVETILPQALSFLEVARVDLDRYVAIAAESGGFATASVSGSSSARNTASPAEGTVGLEGLADLVEEENREVMARRLGEMTAAQRAALSKVLEHPKADAAMLARALGRPEGNHATHLHDGMAFALPEALASIVDFDSGVGGLFQRMDLRGGDTAAVLQSFGKGKAYEILATARRLAMGEGELAIRSGYHVSFGPKSQARYEPRDRIVQSLLDAVRSRDKGRSRERWASYQSKRQDRSARRTVESDLHLGIRTPEGWLEIMEDYKYSDGDQFEGDLREEILGMGVALSDGQIHEARFICNTRLAERTREQIRDVNAVLAKRGVEGRIVVHENFDWRQTP